MKLKKLNLIVETNSNIKKDELIKEGYELIDKDEEKPLQEMTLSELKKIAEENKIEFDKNIKKAELIDLLELKEEKNEWKYSKRYKNTFWY